MATVNNNLSEYDINSVPNASKMVFGIVVSEWNGNITQGLFQGAFDALLDCGAIKEKIVGPKKERKNPPKNTNA